MIENIRERIAIWFDWYKKEIVFGTIIFLAVTISFACGFLLNRSFSHAPIVIEQCKK